MVPPAYLIDAQNSGLSASDWALPLAFAATGDSRSLPPFPVIGLDETGAGMDAIVEPPASIEGLIEQVSARPRAAAVAVQLLRVIETLPPEAALTAESFAYGLLQGSAEHEGWLAARKMQPAEGEGRVLLDRNGDALCVTIDRPAARNAIDRAVRDGLFEAFTLAGLDPEISKVRLRSTGPVFSIGADLAEFGTTRDPAVAHAIRSRTLPAHAILACSARLEVHVQGACIGAGLEMAAFARRITASSRAWFQLPELAMGLIPGAGGCVSVSRRIGRQRTALMILSGRRVSARLALDWGLIDAIVDDPPADDGGTNQAGAQG